MQIEIIKTQEDFLTLKPDWDRLAKGLTPISQFDWAYQWWQHFQQGNNLLILVAKQNNQIVGIAPLYLTKERIFKIFSLKKLCFLGGNTNDYNDFLIQKDTYREIIFEKLINFILKKLSYDLLELKFISTDYPNYDLWQKFKRKKELEFVYFLDFNQIHLNKFEDYQNFYSKLSRNVKSSINYRKNRIKKDNCDLKYIFKEHISEEDLNEIAKTHTKRQEFLLDNGDFQRNCFFKDPKRSNFLKDYLATKQNSEKLLAIMQCDNTIVAYILLFINNKKLYYWNSAFDPAYNEYCPSKLLLNELVQYAYSNDYQLIDFMGGNEYYKEQWSNYSGKIYNFTERKTLKSKLIDSYRKTKKVLN